MPHFYSRRPRLIIALYILAAGVLIILPLWYYRASEADSFSSWGRKSRLPPSPAPEDTNRQKALAHPLNFPTDYHRSPNQEMCNRMYGRGCFAHIDSHQHPYCEPSSSSFLQCFSAPRLPFPWLSQWSSETGDPLWIARGVWFDRDFVAEHSTMEEHGNLNHIDPSTDLSSVPNLADLTEYWGGSGVRGEFQHRWDFSTEMPPLRIATSEVNDAGISTCIDDVIIRLCDPLRQFQVHVVLQGFLGPILPIDSLLLLSDDPAPA